MNKQNRRPNDLTRSYIIALSLVALMTIVSQVVVQVYLFDHHANTTVVNVSGRQRMLSQKIAKLGLEINVAQSRLAFDTLQTHLSDALTLFNTSHQALLKGSSALGIPANINSPETLGLFDQLEAHRIIILKAAYQIQASDFVKDSMSLDAPSKRINEHDDAFLLIMDRITNRYAEEFGYEVSNLRRLEISLMFATLLVLLLTALLIFRPMMVSLASYMDRLNHQNKKLSSVNDELAATNEELVATEEEVTQNLEEIQSIQSNLEHNQKLLEQALMENRNVTAALDNSALVWFTDAAGEVIRVNDAFCEYSGYGLEDLIGNHVIDMVVYEEKTSAFWEFVWQILKSEHEWNGEIALINPLEREKKWMDLYIQGIIGENGEPYRYLFIGHDTTDRKMALDEIKMLSLVAEKTSDGVMIMTTDLKVTWANKSIKKVSGYFSEELIGQGFVEILGARLSSKGQLTEISASFMKKRAFSTEFQIIHKDGRHLWIEMNVTPIFEDKGALYIVVIKDINDRKIGEQKLVELNKKTTQAYQDARLANQKIIGSINYAKRIQRSILPPLSYIHKVIPQSSFFYKPRDIVSGDFYWAAELHGDLYLVVADCTGHGVPGAIMTVICERALSYAVNVRELASPAQILAESDRYLIGALNKGEAENAPIHDGMDASILKYSPKNGTITWAGAKHPLWYYKKGQAEIEVIRGDRFSIGGVSKSEKQFTDHVLEAPQCETLYMFSDGFQDQFGLEGKLGRKRFRKLIDSIHQLTPLEQQMKLNQFFLTWIGEQKQTDDLLVAILKFDR